MNRKLLGLVVIVALLLVCLPLIAIATSPRSSVGPMVTGHVVSIDTTAQTVRLRNPQQSVPISTDSNTLIVATDEAFPSRDGTIVAFSAIRLGDWARAFVDTTRRLDGSYLAKAIVINHREFAVTGVVASIDATRSTFILTWRSRHRRVRVTVGWNENTRVLLRGRRVPISRMTAGSKVHVVGYGTNDGLIAKQIRILWRHGR